MKTKSKLAIAVSAVVISSPALAADSGWYVAPGINYILSDSDRNADDEFGLVLGIGKQLNQRWNIEGSFVMDKLDFSNGGGEFDQKGVMVDGLYYFNRDTSHFAPYAVIGAGLLRTDAGAGSDTNLALNAGLGVEKQITSSGMGLRGDVRYRLDDDDNSVAGQNGFGDWIVGISFKIPFGGKKAAVAAAPVAAAPVSKKPAAKAPVVKDSDGDGVIDSKDRCPGTAKGITVDPNGCEVIILKGVNFETNSAKLTSSSLSILDSAVVALKKRGDIKVEVAGHTDSQGAAAYNQSLSSARADAVRTYLINKGVSAGNLSARGYGENEPVASNGTAAGRAANRRVELRILQ